MGATICYQSCLIANRPVGQNREKEGVVAEKSFIRAHP
jgi:hypothetical protein